MTPLRRALAVAIVLAGALLPPPAGAATEAQQVAFGSVARAGDFDVAPRDLVRLGTPALCFADRDQSGAHGQGEPAYLVLDACGSPAAGASTRTIREGDLRLSGPQAGTRARGGDSDLGVPLTLLPLPTNVRYADFNRDGQWSEGDTLYLHMEVGRSTIAEGDLRLTRAGRSPAGTFVAAGDTDERFTTTDRVASGVFDVAPARAWRFWDTDADSRFGGPDVLYLDVDNSGDATVQDVRLTTYGSQLFGSVAVAGDTDVIPRFSKLGPEPSLCFLDRDGDNAHDAGEPLYLRHEACPRPGPGVAGVALAQGDLRLSGPEAGSKVRGTDPDFGAPSFLLADFALRYADLHLDGQFSEGDALYLHTAAGRATVTPGDLRLTRYGSLAGGTYVAAGDSDVKFGTTDHVASGVFEASPARSWRFWDTNGNAQFDANDMLYLDLDNGGQVTVQDLRLTPLGPFAFGSPVVLGDFDAQPVLMPPLPLALCRGSEEVFLLDRPCDALRPGDLRLSGEVAGTRVAGNQSLGNLSLQPLAPRLRFFDADGTRTWSLADTLYLPMGNATSVTEGDLRLTPYASYAAGSRVRARDADLGVPLLPPAAAEDVAMSWRAWDADGNGRFGARDPLYLDLDARGTVGVLDVRLVRLSTSSAAVGIAVAQIPQLQRTIEDLEATIAQQDEAMKALRDRLGAQNASLARLQAEVEALRVENAALQRPAEAPRTPGPEAALVLVAALTVAGLAARRR